MCHMAWQTELCNVNMRRSASIHLRRVCNVTPECGCLTLSSPKSFVSNEHNITKYSIVNSLDILLLLLRLCQNCRHNFDSSFYEYRFTRKQTKQRKHSINTNGWRTCDWVFHFCVIPLSFRIIFGGLQILAHLLVVETDTFGFNPKNILLGLLCAKKELSNENAEIHFSRFDNALPFFISGTCTTFVTTGLMYITEQRGCRNLGDVDRLAAVTWLIWRRNFFHLDARSPWT